MCVKTIRIESLNRNDSNNNPTASSTSILIVGGGPAGLGLAAHLLTAGWSCRVLERRTRDSLLADTNSFYDMAPSGIQALLRLGNGAAAQKVFDEAIVYDGAAMYMSGKGRPDFSGKLKAGCLGMPMFNVGRAALLQAFVETVEDLDPNCIQFNTNVKSIDHKSGTVVIQGDHQADTTTLKAALVVGADGIHSRIRKQVFGDTGLRSDGIVACYATLPPLTDEEYRTFPHPPKVGPNYGVLGWKGTSSAYALVNKTAIYWYVDFNVDGTPYVGLPPPPDREGGWLGEVRHRFKGIPAMEALFARTSEEQIQVVMCTDRQPLDTYHRGRVVLMGDAAHPFTPFAGLGSSQAMVDSLVLAEALMQSCDCNQKQDQHNNEKAVRVYEQHRLKAANRLMEESRDIYDQSLTNRLQNWALIKVAFPIAKRLGCLEACFHKYFDDSKGSPNKVVPFKTVQEEAGYKLRYEKAKSSLEAKLTN